MAKHDQALRSLRAPRPWRLRQALNSAITPPKFYSLMDRIRCLHQGPSLLIETQVVRSKSELPKEVQGLPVSKAVIYRNVDRKAWEQIVRDNQGVRVAIVMTKA